MCMQWVHAPPTLRPQRPVPWRETMYRSRAYGRRLLGASAATALCLSGTMMARAAGTPLPMHHNKHAPAPSTLPPPELVGDPATVLQRPYSGTPIDVTTYHYH